MGKQMHTERGLVYVAKEFYSKEEAIENGYDYCFYSEELNCDCFSKILDELGHRRQFAIVRRNKLTLIKEDK